MPVDEIEDSVEREWMKVRFTDDQVAEFSDRARSDLHRSAESGSRLIVDQRRRLVELKRHQQKLLDAYMADALAVNVLKERQMKVDVEIADAKRLIANAQTASAEVFSRLEQVISLLTHAEALYRTVDDTARAVLNDAVFGAFDVDSVDDEGVKIAQIAHAPFAPAVRAVVTPERAPEAGRRSGPGNARTPAELALGGSSNVDQLAVHLTQGWNLSTWERVAGIVAEPPVVDRPAELVDRSPAVRHRRLTEQQVDAVATDYLSGLSAAKVGALHGVHHSTVLDHLVARGISRRSRVRRPREG